MLTTKKIVLAKLKKTCQIQRKLITRFDWDYRETRFVKKQKIKLTHDLRVWFGVNFVSRP